HLLVSQPGPWLELHLRAPGYEARGVGLPFSPGIILGATPRHAWGVTNVTGDVQDLYEETLNDEATAARYRDAWEPLTVHEERIAVRGEPEPRTVPVRATRHGRIHPQGAAWCTARYPLREAGAATRPVPGWTGEHEWLGWIPLDELPAETNPARGHIATANHDIQPADYPYVIAKDFHLPFRKRRIEELLE